MFQTTPSLVTILLCACRPILSATAPPPVPVPHVLAWNGYKGAVSLTFDDGEPVHLDIAVPELNRRHLRGTFFLIAGHVPRREEWKNVPSEGHEIGSHSLDHKHAAELSPVDEVHQVENALARLETDLPAQVLTFAYPFSDISPGLKTVVGEYHFLARGGGGVPFLRPEEQPDWLNIPSQVTLTATPLTAYQNWVDTALKEGAWTVFMIHSIENPHPWYEPVPKAVFQGLLDHLSQRQREGLWVAPFGEVGAYWQAQKSLEHALAQMKERDHSVHCAWSVPAVFPRGVVLKLRLDGGSDWRVSQRGGLLRPDADGVYSVAFDRKELTIAPPGPKAAFRQGH